MFSRRAALCLLLPLALVPTSPAATAAPVAGSEGNGETAGEEPLPASADRSAAMQKLHIHGHLTQAYADTDGNQIFGIPGDGTTDYRTLALQLRYNYTRRQAFVIQLSHEREGLSPAQEFRDDIELDWAFYSHQLPTGTTIKVGRVLTPMGLLNEVRDIGTVLPLFRVPAAFYSDTVSARETVDGIVLSHVVEPAKGWEAEISGMFGEWQLLEPRAGGGGGFVEGRAQDGAGLTLTLQTPIDGVRLAIGANRWDSATPNDPLPTEVTSPWVSAEAVFGRFEIRTELVRADGDARYEGGYVQVGIRLTPKLVLNLQTEEADLDVQTLFGEITLHLIDEDAVGLSYAFRPEVVLKGEYHTGEGLQTEDPLPDFRNARPLETDYYIASLSVSF